MSGRGRLTFVNAILPRPSSLTYATCSADTFSVGANSRTPSGAKNRLQGNNVDADHDKCNQ